jgi:hypothetical protein
MSTIPTPGQTFELYSHLAETARFELAKTYHLTRVPGVRTKPLCDISKIEITEIFRESLHFMSRIDLTVIMKFNHNL